MDKTMIKLNSTQVEFEVKIGVELGNKMCCDGDIICVCNGYDCVCM